MKLAIFKKLGITKERWVGALFLSFLFCIGLLFSRLFPGMLKLELSVYDAKLRATATKLSTPSPILLVEIDEPSYGALPDVWPWPRSYYAHLIHNLNRAGAKLIVIDILLDKQNPNHPQGDTLLTNALREHPNVILSAKKVGTIQLLTPALPFNHANRNRWGFINTQEGVDRVVRTYYYGLSDPFGTNHPSLAVEAFRVLNPIRAHTLPELGAFNIAYFQKETPFLTFPIYQVIDDSQFTTKDESDFGESINLFDSVMASGVLKDKIVFVGASVEELHDRSFTPYASSGRNTSGSGVPGVEIHATALHTLLHGFHIKEISHLLHWLCLLVLSILLVFIGFRCRIITSALFLVLLILSVSAANVLLFRTFLLQVPLMPALVTLMMTFAGQQVYFFYLERKKRRAITAMFGHYVPKAVVSQLIQDPTKMQLGGERRELSVLFTDIAGFTTLSESMEPEQLILLLNEYLSEMTAIVHAHGGIIDKYEGDAIMAEFGIPLVLPDHALRACDTAFAMQKRLYELGDMWRKAGKPALTARIGIGTGPMVFGNMGSNQVFDYTVIGDVVNLTSRLEGANKVYGTKIIINEAAYEQSKERMLARELDLIRVKGKKFPVKCFHLMAPKSSPKATEIEQIIRQFEEGILAYRHQEWDHAVQAFKKILTHWPDDGPSLVYIERCERFIRVNPGKTWDGVFSQTTK